MLFARLLLFLLGILIAYLAASLLAGRPLFVSPRGSRDGRPAAGRRTGGPGRKAGGASGTPKTCPVCGVFLEPGERIKSVVFRGGVRSGAVTERMCHIFGCPRCFPANPARPRICPVCGKVVPVDGYLVARMFERPDRPRKHVHVLGCTGCRTGRS